MTQILPFSDAMASAQNVLNEAELLTVLVEVVERLGQANSPAAIDSARSILETAVNTRLRAKPAMLIPEPVLTNWDALSAAIQKVLTSLPHQMSESSAAMDSERRIFQAILHNAAMGRLTKGP